MATSSFLSLLKSAGIIASGTLPVLTPGSLRKDPFPYPRRTVNCSAPREFVKRSGILSPLISPVVMVVGSEATENVRSFLKLPSPLPRRTDNVLFFALADTKSGKPSKFKSTVIK